MKIRIVKSEYDKIKVGEEFQAELTGGAFNEVKFMPGLTKREYFAAMALKNVSQSSWHWGYSPSEEVSGVPERHAGYVAKGAVRIADALIRELNGEVRK